MTDDGVLLDRIAIEDAFRRLGDRLVRRGVVADLYIFGGAAMSMVYDSRRATRDIDAVFHPHGVVLEEAHAGSGRTGPTSVVAERAGQRLHSSRGRQFCLQSLRSPRLTSVGRLAEHLLAMKVLAGRRRDAEDVKVLVAHLELTSVAQALALCADIFPDEEVPPRARLILEGIFDPEQS